MDAESQERIYKQIWYVREIKDIDDNEVKFSSIVQKKLNYQGPRMENKHDHSRPICYVSDEVSRATGKIKITIYQITKPDINNIISSYAKINFQITTFSKRWIFVGYGIIMQGLL